MSNQTQLNLRIAKKLNLPRQKRIVKLTEDELQDDRNADLRGPANASVSLSNADAEKGSENENDGFPPQILETLEDLSNDRALTPISEPKESAELQANINSGVRGEKEPALQDQPTTNLEGHGSDSRLRNEALLLPKMMPKQFEPKLPRNEVMPRHASR